MVCGTPQATGRLTVSFGALVSIVVQGAESSQSASHLPRTRRIRHSICLLFFCDLKGGELSARWGDIL
jgi:hypothetical protein